MIVRSKAPLRISLAGGGTDLAAYSTQHGGMVLNTTINMFAHAMIIPRKGGIVLRAIDRDEVVEQGTASRLDIDGKLDLAKGVYNRIVKDYNHSAPLSFELQTFVDAPAGSGLGSSSTLVVAMVSVFAHWLNLPLGEYEVAKLAHDIERKDLGFEGGCQDQYAATFGGWNFMEFSPSGAVLVNPLRIKEKYLQELEFNLVLYYTGTSRLSSAIIAGQIENLQDHQGSSLDGMHKLKDQAVQMKAALLTGDLGRMGDILNFGWKCKKETAANISNPQIDDIYDAAMRAGATGGKISGAGGGGYMMFYCPGNSRYSVIKTLELFGGEVHRLQFSKRGVLSWDVP